MDLMCDTHALCVRVGMSAVHAVVTAFPRNSTGIPESLMHVSNSGA